ncbi:NAD-dependent epimerase/dehydratase family protein [Vibrio vulnificus]|nr:NAD-dependent epimerase/dehydratase family protein [Vibrio vulnificus]
MILVTGSTGFIGSNLVINLNCPFKVVLRLGERSQHESFCVNSINQYTNWGTELIGIKTVIHLAGIAHSRDSNDFRSVNVDGTLKLAEAAAQNGVKRFVFVSSIGVNGISTQHTPFSPSSRCEPHNMYAESKYEAEQSLIEIADRTGLEVVIVRPTLVYGPNAPGNFRLLTKLVSKLRFLPFGFANNKRDFISVNNLADLLVTCATHPNAAGHTFLASDGETVSIKEFTNAIAKGLGKKVFQLPVPVTLMRLAGKLTGKSAMIEQLYGNLEVDSSNIKQVLGWTPPFTMEQSMAFLKHTDK